VGQLTLHALHAFVFYWPVVSVCSLS